MRRLASELVTYTEQQADDLREMYPRKQVTAAPNSLYSADEMGFDANSMRNSILYVGRLVDAKKPDLLVSAFELVASDLPQLRLTIVGDGPARSILERRIAETGFGERIRLIGHESRPSVLRGYYSAAIASVSPGCAGLSITQSFGFGVPALIARDEPHGPEIEAASEGFNALFFQSNDPGDLASGIRRAARQRSEVFADGAAIAESSIRRYSIEAMAAGLIQAIEGDERCLSTT
ncbi:glycosyltransferase [Micromonospora sp. A200]|uniref:glycosyltransferase n=1 Tax=Micromonospora sp. A200 TaxID=2940568 RepID=UPI0024751948|nr:glycosyltransferase [Micromonospora sp. A200]